MGKADTYKNSNDEIFNSLAWLHASLNVPSDELLLANGKTYIFAAALCNQVIARDV